MPGQHLLYLWLANLQEGPSMALDMHGTDQPRNPYRLKGAVDGIAKDGNHLAGDHDLLDVEAAGDPHQQRLLNWYAQGLRQFVNVTLSHVQGYPWDLICRNRQYFSFHR